MPDPTPDPLLNTRVRHETRDVRFRPVLIATLIGAILLAVQLGLVYFFDKWETARHADHNGPTHPLAPRPSATLPGEPRLEALRTAVEQLPASSVEPATIDGALRSAKETARYTQVPIERAVERIVEQERERTDVAARSFRESGLYAAGESNSGRVFREPLQ